MGDLRLFIWGGRRYRVDASRKLGSYIFHWFRENPVENILVTGLDKQNNLVYNCKYFLIHQF